MDAPPTSPSTSTSASPEAQRHVSWLELFFDLVVVVGINQLVHLLHSSEHHGPSGMAIFGFLVLYLALWMMWAEFMVYANLEAGATKRRTMLIGMGCLSLMTASVPGALADRANVFIVTLAIASIVATSGFVGSGRLRLNWHAAWQIGLNAVPFVISFFVSAQPWKLLLWLTGLLFGLWFTIISGARSGEPALHLADRRLRERQEAALPLRLDSEGVHAPHLGERLGLFVIIVLGEAMLQLVGALADAPWTAANWAIFAAAPAGFVLLVGLWWMNVRYGFGETSRLHPTFLMIAHFLVTSGTTLVATGLGAAVGFPFAHLPTSTRWLLCAGLAVNLLVVALMALSANSRWLGLIPVGACLVLGVVAALIPGYILVCLLTLITGLHILLLRSRFGR